ncbi:MULTISPECIES: hypothetical protein [Morganellaceae]|uniref:hypothetical protein n=1 Tax=Morganellaceae TaxID=1903414 RepID=UPI00288B8C24|nr:hypothetical protein [Proteus terrae]
MAINQSEIEVGYLYRTSTNQERLVLKIDSDGAIIYSSRGGNVQNPFDHKVSSKPERFANACDKKVKKYDEDEFLAIKKRFEDRGLI